MKSASVRLDVDEQARRHFMAFVEVFLAPELAARWVTLFDAGRTSAWRKIDPWKLWDPEHLMEGHHCEPCRHSGIVTLQTLAAPLPSDTPVCIFHLGHSMPAVHTLSLREITREHLPLEGVVSLVAGHIALVFNHDGEGLVFKR